MAASEISATVRRIMEREGRNRLWVIDRMNELMPEIEMDQTKFSGITTGHRNMSADEMLAFCMALQVSPDEFLV